MKKLGTIVLALGLVLGMSACSSRDPRTNVKDSAEEMTVLLSDGRELFCIKVGAYGVSCDWATAK